MGRYLLGAFALIISYGQIGQAANHTILGQLYPKGNGIEFISKECRGVVELNNLNKRAVSFLRHLTAKQSVSVSTNGTCSQGKLILTNAENITVHPNQLQGDAVLVYPQFVIVNARIQMLGKRDLYPYVQLKYYNDYRITFEGTLYDRGLLTEFIKRNEGLTSDPRFMVQGVFTDAHSIEPHFIVPVLGSGDTPDDLPLLAEGRFQATQVIGQYHFIFKSKQPLAFELVTLDDEAKDLADQHLNRVDEKGEKESFILEASYNHWSRQIVMHSSSEVKSRVDQKCEFTFLKPYFEN